MAYALFGTLLGLNAGCERYWVCEEVEGPKLDTLPPVLSETGLFDDMATETLSAGVLSYRPRFELWSDGAEKRRWLRLPEGKLIDTRDADTWIFPQGTQVWKEFVRDGVRVETRLLQKFGPRESDWAGVAYLWNEDQADAAAVPYGALAALGTPHNVPAASECGACHGGTLSHVLGVSAIELGAPAQDGDVDIRWLMERGLLSDPPNDDDVELALPGSATEQAALGYLHANCSHCHNQTRPSTLGARCFAPENELDFKLSVQHLDSVADTATYKTMLSAVKPGHPQQSKLIDLVSERGMFKQMPPLATELVDQQAVDLLSRWIKAL